MKSLRFWLFTIKGKCYCSGSLTIPREYPTVSPIINFDNNEAMEQFLIYLNTHPWTSDSNLHTTLTLIKDFIAARPHKPLARTRDISGALKAKAVEGGEAETPTEEFRVSEEDMKAVEGVVGRLKVKLRGKKDVRGKDGEKSANPSKSPNAIPTDNADSGIPPLSSNRMLTQDLHQRVSTIVNLQIRDNQEEEKKAAIAANAHDNIPQHTDSEDNKESDESNRNKALGEWWYTFRSITLSRHDEQLNQLKSDQTVTCLQKAAAYIQLYFDIFILKLGYSPKAIIVYFLLAILGFACTIVVLFYILIGEQANGACCVGIIGNSVCGVFLIWTSLYLIRRIANPTFEESNVFIVIIEVAARLVYDVTGIFVAVYYLLDHKLTGWGIAFLALFATYLFLWYKFEGLRLVMLVLQILLKLLNAVCMATCCEPWKGVKAVSVLYDSAAQSNKCVICQTEFNSEGELIGLSCHATHVFHNGCLVEWIRYKKECPCCKLMINMNSHPVLRTAKTNTNA
eukprot:TRINITY_DN6600_c0_g1_i2.p1 TRINITY_DN6600_c0_g1~~TRINITY_DN6600_c0_g1_i2.p1  ORF type:complete len:511 (+),score=48.00 TRINITY_DN6600_c0_g1_i2:166-1698(+)